MEVLDRVQRLEQRVYGFGAVILILCLVGWAWSRADMLAMRAAIDAVGDRTDFPDARMDSVLSVVRSNRHGDQLEHARIESLLTRMK